MKTQTILWLLALTALLIAGCGDDDDGGGEPTVRTDAEVLADAWTAYEAADWAAAETEFRELLGRGTRDAEAHDGLGWTFGAQSAPDSAHVHFGAAVAAGADTMDIADQTHAGLAFTLSALQEYEDCLVAAAEVDDAWVFPHDDAFDHDAVVLLTASAWYVLGDFEASLAALQVIDPGFAADVSTAAGRAALAARIEELQG